MAFMVYKDGAQAKNVNWIMLITVSEKVTNGKEMPTFLAWKYN